MFSEALGLIGGIGSLIDSGRQARLAQQELAYKYKALDESRNQAMLQIGLGRDQLNREVEQERYVRGINERNLLQQEQERARMRVEGQQRLDQYQRERDYAIERQVELDRKAAEQRAFQLEQYLSNRNIAADERRQALTALAEAQAVARGEREDDLRRLAEEKATAQFERQWAVDQFNTARNVASQERLEDLSYRDRILGAVSNMSARMQEAFSRFGDLTVPEQMSERDILGTISRYEDNATANVDRAADRVASQMEAGLLDQGMGRSTTATARRAEIARRLALDYDNARLSARNQAMEYIQGRDRLNQADFERRLAARGQAASEVTSIYAPEIEALANSRQTLSANAFQAPVAIGSGVVQRGVSSANDYQGPLAIGSSIYEPSGVGSGIGDTLTPPSTADAYRITSDYNAFSPAMWNISSPQGYFGIGTQMLGSLPGQYDMANTYLGLARSASAGGWNGIGTALNNFEKSDLYQSWFGKKEAGPDPWSGMRSTTPLPTARPQYTRNPHM